MKLSTISYHTTNISYLWLIIFIILNVFIDWRCDACSCQFIHPQEQACNSDFVIVATVRGRYKISNDTMHDSYKIQLQALYKATPEAREVLRYGRILTPSFGSLCGIHLKTNATYLIAGNLIPKGTVETDICHQPLPKDFQLREAYHQVLLQRYIEQFGCSCTLSERARRRMIRRGRYPIEKADPPHCKIIRKGNKQYARSVVRTMAPLVTLCSFQEEWKDITVRQRKGFKKLYYHGCDCDLLNINRPREPLPPGCIYSYKTDCINSHGICLPDSNGFCRWTRNQAQQKCERTMEQF